ncbi:hypothetical protein COT97_05345 [Candidatus Falkowbacteria bacterium CG10_big_fil_rev_8_21_14_0_10_39_11]|uniref:Leucine-rich repeat domain-containing protein n=1 Tax=Candidatus Falkowbacteria bacterium CG10_big_fil_rev_8_21_14_0_10_39_11 TaxID=1974565 RepID=A0A2H0V3Q4_9BACT|nr:MAG: hypothetical protein COT97_05345 [Candidatus Falkowbacteria bacterium CG10_big_fil_rev_8_21_14_0_10_39_11]
MSIKFNPTEMMAGVSEYKFTDPNRQKQYLELLADLNLIIKKNTPDEIWNDVALMEQFTLKLNAIIALHQEENVEREQTVWTNEQCIAWAAEAGFKNPEEFVMTKFVIGDAGISVRGDLNLSESAVTSLPAGITQVEGSLILARSSVETLPETLVSIGHTLDLQLCPLVALPDSLETIGGSFNLQHSNLKVFPRELVSIGGNLYLENNVVENMPANIKRLVRGVIVYS